MYIGRKIFSDYCPRSFIKQMTHSSETWIELKELKNEYMNNMQ